MLNKLIPHTYSIYGKLSTRRYPLPLKQSTRQFWVYWANIVTNKVYQDRIDEVGPEQACAEWLMRNGCEIKWSTREKMQTSYEDMPDLTPKTYIQAIKAESASIMATGFDHFKNVKGPEKILFRRCYYLSDEALEKLEYINHSLRHLQLISCHNITDDGACSLTRLRNLKFLKIFDLSSVKDIDECREHLQQGLPECLVDWPKL